MGPESPYPGSVVWKRVTTFFGIDSGETYMLVQVVDENFKAIEPAFSDMVLYESKRKEVGHFAGWMFYRSMNPSPTPEGEQLVDKINKKMILKWVVFWIVLLLGICCFCGCCAGLCHWCCCRKRKSNKRGLRKLFPASTEEEEETDSYEEYEEDDYEYYPQPPPGYYYADEFDE
mmetsp:Transcript_78482/g.148160  ORF Transcript_78482/g.148160 Transcript_78482/m.148160 type:complete len:174 (-) Transcript_78482:25-546(-)